MIVLRLMEQESVSRATAFRILKARRAGRLAKAAHMGNGRDHLNAHREGWHPTPPRGTRALLAVESVAAGSLVWECACGAGDISIEIGEHTSELQ